MARRGLDAEVQKIIDAVEDRGYSVVEGGKHLKVIDGAGAVRATLAKTPSDWRTHKNDMANLRRAGVLERKPDVKPDKPLPDYQVPIRDKAAQVIAALSHGAFAEHVKTMADRNLDARGFKSKMAAQWHVGQLVNHSRPVARWAAEHIEAAADDLLTMPPVPEPKEEVVEVAVAVGRIPQVDELTRAKLEEMMRSIQEGLGIKARSGRQWGHGVWLLGARLALESCERHNIDPGWHPRTGVRQNVTREAAIASRLRTVVDGQAVWASTREMVEALVSDWDDGYRLREDMIDRTNYRAGGNWNEIPNELAAPESLWPMEAFEADRAKYHRVPPKEESALYQAIPDDEPYESPNVERQRLDEEARVAAIEETPVVREGLEIAARFIGKALEWQNELPLHLDVMRVAMLAAGMPETLVAEMIGVACRVLRSEVGLAAPTPPQEPRVFTAGAPAIDEGGE